MGNLTPLPPPTQSTPVWNLDAYVFKVPKQESVKMHIVQLIWRNAENNPCHTTGFLCKLGQINWVLSIITVGDTVFYVF